MRVGLVQSVNLQQGHAKTQRVQKHEISTQKNLGAITFTGLKAKNMNQIASITPENNGIVLPETKQGGEGAVAYELPNSLRKHENIDARSFMSYWSHNNQEGGYKFLVHPKNRYPNGVADLPKQMPMGAFHSAPQGVDREAFAAKFNLTPSEVSYVMQSKPNNGESRYCILDPTDVCGEIKRVSEDAPGEVKTIKYRLFKISPNNHPKNVRIKDQPHYVLYTPDLAKAAKPYSYDSTGMPTFKAELSNADWMRALAEVIHKKMDTDEFGHFNPASVLCHDRPAHTYMNHIANMSSLGDEAVDGLKIHAIAHNTGRFYQGYTFDPFEFLAVVGDEKVANELKNSEHYDLILKAKRLGMDSDELLPSERLIVKNILDPYLTPFKDGEGAYNIMKTAIVGVKANPENFSTGTVSHTFDKEMKSHDTPEAARYLTDDYASIKTKSVLNGSTPANLRLDDADADFGEGNNGLSAKKAGFKTYKYDGKNIKEIIATREENGKWLTRLMSEAAAEGQDALNKLFFNTSQLEAGQKVMGSLNEIKDKGIFIMSWGRPDEQKGFPILLKGFKKFLERKNISLKDKLRFRILSGAGKWNENDADYKAIESTLNEIATMDGGKYKGLAAHVDGYFPNRLIGCATYGAFTSRREMCGITPLESKTAGSSYLATKTGGPVDYTTKKNGYLTKEAVEGPPEKYGLTWKTPHHELDNARVERQAEQVADIFEKILKEQKGSRKSYIAKCKKNIEEQIDWHNNDEYNKGKSANKTYLEDILETDKGWEARNKNPLRRLFGYYDEVNRTAEQTFGINAKNKPTRIALLIITGGLLLVGGSYLLLKNKNNNKQKLDKAA